MTSKEFTIWLKGFITACNDYAPTPKQWDIIKEELEKVEDKTLVLETPKFPFGTPNTYPLYDPYNPYKVTCQQPDTNGTILTTTPGVSGTITIANPNLVSWGSGSLSTSTTYGYPSGSAWHYTNSNEKVF
jgi:hypothetical protein